MEPALAAEEVRAQHLCNSAVQKLFRPGLEERQIVLTVVQVQLMLYFYFTLLNSVLRMSGFHQFSAAMRLAAVGCRCLRTGRLRCSSSLGCSPYGLFGFGCYLTGWQVRSIAGWLGELSKQLCIFCASYCVLYICQTECRVLLCCFTGLYL